MIMDWAEEGKGGEFIVYPEGTYLACVNGYQRVTASTGTEQIRWKMSILKPEEYVSKPVTLHTPLTEKSLWKIARFVKACGVEVSGLGKMETVGRVFDNVLDSCLRRTVYLTMTVGLDNKGRERNDINEFKLDSEQKPKAVDEVVELMGETPEFLK